MVYLCLCSGLCSGLDLWLPSGRMAFRRGRSRVVNRGAQAVVAGANPEMTNLLCPLRLPATRWPMAIRMIGVICEGKTMRKQTIILLAVAFLCVNAVWAFAPVQYQVKQKYVLGGDGGWDALTFDPAGKRLFISRGTHVMVVDPYKGTVLGDIPDTQGVHDIALAQELGKGFISNGRDNSITVFDLKTLKETARIKIEGDNPDAMLYDPSSKRVFAFNGRSKNATVIDAVAGTVVGNIPLDGKPEFGVADGKGMVFVNIEDKSEVTSIDAKKAAVEELAACALRRAQRDSHGPEEPQAVLWLPQQDDGRDGR